MKLVVRYDRKRGELDYFIRPEPGPVPPIVEPPEPGEPKDSGPAPKHPRKAPATPKSHSRG